jgi:hypothetical protein
MGFTAMMEIQAKSIPPLLQGRDVLGAAKTGRSITQVWTISPPEKMKWVGPHFWWDWNHAREKDIRRTSISGTTFSGEKYLSGTIFHAIWLDFSMLFDNL